MTGFVWLEESLAETAAELRDLPARTLGRRVGVIMSSGATKDEELADAIVGIRLGTRTEWSHAEMAQILEELKGEEKRLDRWLTTWTTRNQIKRL